MGKRKGTINKWFVFMMMFILLFDIAITPVLAINSDGIEEVILDNEVLEEEDGLIQDGLIEEGNDIEKPDEGESNEGISIENPNEEDLTKQVDLEIPDLKGDIFKEETVNMTLDDFKEPVWIYEHGYWVKIVTEDTLDWDALYVDSEGLLYYQGKEVYEYRLADEYFSNEELQHQMTIGPKQRLLTEEELETIGVEDLSYTDPDLKTLRMSTMSVRSSTNTNKEILGEVPRLINMRSEGKTFQWGNTFGDGFMLEVGGTRYVAFCIDFPIQGPSTDMRNYSKLNLYENDKIKKALYYGYGGPESVYTNENQGRIITTAILTRLTQELTGKDVVTRDHLEGYSKLWDKVTKGETPDSRMKFTTSKSDNSVTVSVSDGVQKSNTITFDTFSKNSTKITLKDNVKLVRTKSKTGRTLGTYSNEVTIYGGDEFHFTAPLSKGGNFSTGALSSELPLYTPVMTRHTTTNYQPLASLQQYKDPSNTTTITVPFVKRTANVTINHVDVSRPTGHKDRIFKKETKTVTVGSKFTATKMTNKHLSDNYKDPYIRSTKSNHPHSVTIDKVSSNGNTINLYYTTQWDLTVLYKDNQNGSTFRNAGTTEYVYDASYKHVSPEWSTNTAKNSVRHYDKKHYDYRNDYGGKTSRTEANRTKSGKMPRKNLTIEFTYDPHGYVGVEWKNLFPEKGYDVFDKTLNPTLSDTRTGVDPLNKKGNKVVWTGIGSNLRTEFDMYQHGTKFEYSQPRFITVGDRTYERENDSKYTGSVGYQVYPVQTGSTYTPHQFKYRLIREVTVNFLDDRTGEPIAEPKVYEVKQGYNPSTGTEPSVTQARLNSGYAWAEEPPEFSKDGYSYRYVRHDGDPESGVVGTDHIEINYFYDLPLIDTGLEKIQIYTAPAAEGLPVIVDLAKKYIYSPDVPDMFSATIDVNLYKSNKKIDGKTYTARSLPTQIDFTVSSTELEKDEQDLYTVKLEGFNSNDIKVPDDRLSIATDGYTSAETTLEIHSNDKSQLDYTGVIKTERSVGEDMIVYNESFSIPIEPIKKMKTGYGFYMPVELAYENELSSNVINPSFEMIVPETIVDKSFIHYLVTSNKAVIPLEKTENKISLNRSKINQKFELQHVNVEKETGHLFSDAQVNNNDSRIKNDLISGDRKFYLPIWSYVGEYDLYVNTSDPIGINLIDVKINHNLDIIAHMLAHIDSETLEQDAIHVRPVNSDNPFPVEIPEGWTQADIDWIMNYNIPK